MENTPKKENNINEQTTPKKQRMDNDDRKTVTFQVKNLGDIVISPRKQKDGTQVNWFQFAAVNEDGTK